MRDTRVRWGILGPLLVVPDHDNPVPLPTGRLRVLLATLLTHTNIVVPLDELVDILWDGIPPAGAASTVRVYVVRLRRALGPAAAARISTQPNGYLCQTDPDELDLSRFEKLHDQAAEAARAQQWSTAAELLAAALGLWRGTPLADVPSQLLRDRELPRLERLHLSASEAHIDARIHLGQHEQLIPLLQDLTARHPLREHLHAQLMLVLAEVGRRAEALEVYQRARELLRTELDAEPGPELQAQHRQLLTAPIAPPTPKPVTVGASTTTTSTTTKQDSQDGSARAAIVPRQLPAAIPHFTGRSTELKALSALLDDAASAVVVAAIAGTAGVGKTALAIHWAHNVTDAFPDGQLYANLRGFLPGSAPLDPGTVLGAFLTALGMPANRVPPDLDGRVGLYRSCLADRRVLIILDNARDVEQVRPLLPGAPGSLALVTSRNQLTGLVVAHGATPIALDLLTLDEARDLLVRRLGADTVAREATLADELIELCARLPLALNIAIAQVAVSATGQLAPQVARLRDTRERLATLSTDDSTASVHGVFTWSYQLLEPAAARLFRLLGLRPGPDISLPAAASLAGLPMSEARRLLGALTAAHLLDQRVPGRYSAHDLLRDFAAERVAAEETEHDRRAATHRLLDHYLATAFAANTLLYPGSAPIEAPSPVPGVTATAFTDNTAALDWFEAERAGLVAAVLGAADAGFGRYAWQLTSVLVTSLSRGGHLREWTTVCQAALAAATAAADLPGQAQANRWLGNSMVIQGRIPEALAHQTRALALFEQLGDQRRQASTHLAIALTRERQDHLDEALAHAHQALELSRSADHAAGQAWALNGIGWFSTLLGQHEQAIAYCAEVLELCEGLGDRSTAASALDTLGHAHRYLGQPAEATRRYQQATDLRREIGDNYYAAQSLRRLGDVHAETGNHDAARAAWQQAHTILADLGHPEAEDARRPATREKPPS